MTKIDPIFFEKIGSSIDHLPLNYSKAKIVFDSNKPVDHSSLIKFISIEQLQTKKGVITSFNKPISKCFTFHRNDETT